ncbi:MAG TPA: DNA polymerase/3'-5' exonuclease PolX [Alphaproteobacteria bacterium]|jgi:DNA polymerase (family 10)
MAAKRAQAKPVPVKRKAAPPPAGGRQMANEEIAQSFEDIADLLEIQGENPFRIRAYRNAARTVTGLPNEAAALVAQGKDLSEFPGIGEDLAGKIADLATTGTTELLEKLKKQFPPGLVELLRVPALGPKRVALLHKKLRISDLAGLRAAVDAGKLAKLAGFGPKLVASLTEAVAPAAAPARRYTLAEAAAEAEPLAAYLRKVSGVERVEIAGSYRRGRETVGDIDILAAVAKGSKAVQRFVAYERAEAVLAEGGTRAAIRLKGGLQVDLRVVARPEFGAALYYFTGSKAHNIAVRAIAVKKKLKINEYGVFRGEKRIAGETEESVFAAADLPYIPPELREDRGEIDAARAGKLPKLVEAGDIRGDFHCRSDASDGRDSLEALVAAAKKRKLAYIAIADPCRRIASANRLDLNGLARQGAAIDRINAAQKDVLVLKGVEVAIREDGSLDLPDEALAGLDLVVAAVVDQFALPAEKQTARLLRALDAKRIGILAHPLNRVFPQRAAMSFSLERVIAAARARGCYLELNARPERLDLSDIACRAAKEAGAGIALGSDARSGAEFANLRWGVATARRGWLEAGDLLNSRSAAEARAALRKTMG